MRLLPFITKFLTGLQVQIRGVANANDSFTTSRAVGRKKTIQAKIEKN